MPAVTMLTYRRALPTALYTQIPHLRPQSLKTTYQRGSNPRAPGPRFLAVANIRDHAYPTTE